MFIAMSVSVNKTYSAADLKFLNLLSEKFPTIADATTEIINLEAILNLPKGTEHFLTDLHGEYEAFRHVLKNASGVIRQKVHEVFNNTLRESEMTELCTLIYYPAEKLQLIKQKESNLDDWYKVTLNQLTEVCRAVSVKYTRSKVRKMLPPDFSYVIQELLHESDSPGSPKQSYFNGILNSIISIGRADAFIIAMSNVIQCLTIDRLHIIGDIFDRGPGPHFIFDTLAQYKMYDIQWGNHDILWMGAAAGNLASIANVIRVSARYDNLDVLEDGYGINLLPLARFAMEVYENSPCKPYQPKVMQNSGVTERDVLLMAQMHKAISVIQFKIEGQMIKRHPEYKMEGRALLEKIDYEKGTIEIDGKDYPLKDADFPTVDPRDPYKLTPGEDQLIRTLQASFLNSDNYRNISGCSFEGQYVSDRQFEPDVPRFDSDDRRRGVQNSHRGRKTLCRTEPAGQTGPPDPGGLFRWQWGQESADGARLHVVLVVRPRIPVLRQGQDGNAGALPDRGQEDAPRGEGSLLQAFG